MLYKADIHKPIASPWSRAMLALGLVGGLGISGQAGAEVFSEKCDGHDKVKAYLQEALGKNLTEFHIGKLNPELLNRQLSKGQVTLNLPNPKNELVRADIPTDMWRIHGERGSYGFIKGKERQVETVKLNPDIHFRLGECSKRNARCGAITVLDRDWTQVEGFIHDKELGFSFFEPIHFLLASHGKRMGSEANGCHILYNSDFHREIPFPTEHEHKGLVAENGNSGAEMLMERMASYLGKAGDFLISPAHAMPRPTYIPISLDSDAAFYQLGTGTVWSRQSSVIFGVNIMYGILEPIGNNNWQIIFRIDSQETWLPGYGPTTRDKYALRDEINDPGYFMLSHPNNNEVSYYFVGYDMNGGIAGVAGGICNVEDYDHTFGSAEAHQRNHAWGQQVADDDAGYEFSTLYGRMIVAAHEIGHMLGATHGDGLANTCGAGSLSGLCGSSMMKSGAAGGVAPDFRKAFFTPANSQNILECVDDVY